MAIKDKLFEARTKKGLTQLQLAKQVGAAQATVNKLESGNLKNPSFKLAVKIANALGKNVFDIFGDESLRNTINEMEIDRLKILAFHALERHVSNKIFFTQMQIDENSSSADEWKKNDEYVNQLNEFKRGVYETFVNVGFCTQEEISEYKAYINPNKKNTT